MPSLGRWLTFGTIPLLAAMASPLVAQAPAPSPSSYANEASVVEKLVEKISYSNDGTYTDERTARIRIQSAAGVQQYGLLRLPYPSSVGDDQISYVRVTKPDGTVVSTPPENIQDLPEQITIQAPFYSDLKEKQVAVKGLETGDVLEFNARFEARSPEVPGQFWSEYSFHDDQIVLDEEFQIAIPAGRAVTLKSPRIQPTITDADGQRVYSWKTNNLQHKSDAEIAKENAASEPKSPDIQLTSFRSWDEVAQWYRQLQASRADPTPEIRAKAAELTKDAASDADKIRILYDYVGAKFRYIGIAFGIGRYQPHAAPDVLSNGFGDCKDKYTLLAALLASVGLKSYPVLVNSVRKIDPDVPSPGQFNHVINAIPQGKDFLWLDTTAEVAPEGYLSEAERDKQSLLISDSEPGRLVQLPADLAFPQQFVFTTTGKIDGDGTLVTQTEIRVRGDLEVVLRVLLHQTPQPQWKQLVQGFSQGLNFTGTVDDPIISSPEATAEPLDLKYTYTRKTFTDWPDQIAAAVPFPYLAALPDDDNAVPDQIPLQPVETRFTSEIELPPGVTPQLRPPVNVVTDFAEYRSTDTWNSGVLRVERRYVSHLKKLPKARTAAYRSFWKSVNADENALFRLTRNSPTSVFPSANDAAPDSAEAAKRAEIARLVKIGQDAAQKRNLPGAIDAMRQLLALDPTAEGRMYLSGLESRNNNYKDDDEVYADLKKALDIKPALETTLDSVASTFAGMHKDDDALAAWRKELDFFPNDLTAPVDMGNFLIDRKRYDDAVAVLRPAADEHPEAANLNFVLGKTYILIGDSAHAREAFSRTLADDPSPRFQNDIAYFLADDTPHLDDALSYARKAVAGAEERTGAILPASLSESDLRTMNELVAYWDTLGWVQFRIGNLDAAENYLKAAWDLSQSGTVGDHLGQLYQKEGKRDQAIHLFELAASAQDPTPETGNRLDALLGGKNAVKRAQSDALSELSEMRRIKLPRVAPGEVHAEAFLFYRGDKGLYDVKVISGAPNLRDVLLKANLRALFPEASSATIVRRGVVYCAASSNSCDLYLVTPNLVSSVN